jgi:hypothetical protein
MVQENSEFCVGGFVAADKFVGSTGLGESTLLHPKMEQNAPEDAFHTRTQYNVHRMKYRISAFFQSPFFFMHGTSFTALKRCFLSLWILDEVSINSAYVSLWMFSDKSIERLGFRIRDFRHEPGPKFS